MSAPTVAPPAGTVRVSRTFVVGTALGLAVVNGFVVTALRGAVGSVSRVHTPLGTWLLEVAVTAPLLVVGIGLASVLVGRRRPLDSRAGVVLTTLAVVLVGLVVGGAALVVDALTDHALQVAALQDMAGMDGMSDPATTATLAAANADVHARAVALGLGVLSVVDTVLVGWVVALHGGHVGRTAR